MFAKPDPIKDPKDWPPPTQKKIRLGLRVRKARVVMLDPV